MLATSLAANRAMAMSHLRNMGRGLPSTSMRVTTALSMRHRASLMPVNPKPVALLIPIRGIGTSGNRVPGTGGSDGPPPGFKIDEARKPLKKEDSSAKAVKANSSATPQPAQAGLKTDLVVDPTAQIVAQKETGVATRDDDAKKAEKKGWVQWLKHEALHYWDGTKLLATEVKISTRLALRMAAGYELTRRENRQLQRTVRDVARLVPFAAFVIVPFAELLLPFALKLFPNLMPSTYESQNTKDKKALQLRSTRKEVSTFLRQTLKDSSLPLSPATARKEEFTNFFRKVRATGEKPTPEDVIKVCRIFKDDVTLDNLSRPQLVSMCRYLGMSTYGTDGMLRYQIRVRMRQIKDDDRAISFEGVDSLTVSELQAACQNRGIPSYGVSPAKMRDDLQTWLQLRLKEGVPSTLLVLSNAYMYGQSDHEGGMAGQIDALIGVLSSIPEELFHEIELEVHTAEGAATNKQRLEVLKEQEELIDEENVQNEATSKSGVAIPSDTEDIDEKEERSAHAEANRVNDDQAEVAIAGERNAAVGEPVDAAAQESEKPAEKK